MKSRWFKLLTRFFLVGVIALISFSSQVLYADTTDADAHAETDSNGGSNPDIPLDASYEEFIDYADTYLQDMPDPEHMWSGDSGISLFSDVPSLLSTSPYWGSVDGHKVFYDANGAVYANPAIKVIDVSVHQGIIDWEEVKNSDVDAVILRIGYGVGNEDGQFERNLAEVRRLGIPYGIYLYSYAYDSNFAAREAAWTATLLDRYGTEGMELPIYYDLEEFVWTGYYPPTDPDEYEAIVNAYCDTMASRGYSNVHVYSYRAYLQTALNKPSIWERTSWIAAYTRTIGIDNPYYVGQRGWQYTASGSVPGINGNADISAFTNWDFVNVEEMPLVDLDDGTYYINAHLKDSSGVTIPGGSLEAGTQTQLWSYDHSASQRFLFTRQDDGSYVITNEASGLALDVQSAIAQDGAVVQQYEPNGTPAQRWFIRDSGNGYYLQSELGNWVLDIEAGMSSDGTSIRLYSPNGSAAQRFMLAAPSSVPTDTALRISSSLDNAKVIDIDGASRNDGARAQLYSWNQTDAQLFIFREVGNAIYEIESVETGKVIEVGGGQTGDGAKVNQYSRNGTLSQHWSILDTGDGLLTFINCNTGKALDVPAGVAADFTQLQIFSRNNSSAQSWMIEEYPTSRERIDQFAQENRGTVVEGTYAIASVMDQTRVIDVSAGSLSNGANVQLYLSNGSGAQLWHFSEDEDGYLTITNVGSQKALDVNAGAKTNGTNIQQFESNGSYAQKWIAVRDSDGAIRLYSALAENMVLDLSCGSTSDGTNVNLFENNGSDAQRFRLFSALDVPESDDSLENGTYEIVAPSGKAFDIPGGSTADGVQLQVYEANGTSAQSFVVTYDDSLGSYTFSSLSSDKVLEVANGSFVPGAGVQQTGASAVNALQRHWAIESMDDETYLIYNTSNGLVIGLSDHDQLIMVAPDDSRAVAWKFNHSSTPGTTEELEAIASDQGVVIEDGVYRILSSHDDDYALDVSAGGKDNGSNVQIYTANGTPAQDWQITNLPNGFVTITNVNSGKCLDVANGATVSGSNVWQYQSNGTIAQEWLPVRQDDGSIVLFSAIGNGLVLDVQGGVIQDYANAWIYTVNYSDAQRFFIVE